MEWTGYLILFAVGLVAGVVNVLAGGGSFLTLPMLMFLGLPAGVANGTNRVGILLQNVGASWSFRRHGVLDLRSLTWAAAPTLAGTAVGTWLALVVSDEAFKRILALLMVGISLWTLWAPGGRGTAAPRQRRPGPAVVAAFFAIGIYGGFVQAGVGFFILAATTFVGLDLVRGNAVKVLTILCSTALSVCLFALKGRVDWALGLTLAAGALLGGLVGARLTVVKGHRWLRGIVTAAVVVFAVKLWLSS